MRPLCFTLLIAVALVTPAAAQDKTWVDKTILLKKAGIKIGRFIGGKQVGPIKTSVGHTRIRYRSVKQNRRGVIGCAEGGYRDLGSEYEGSC